MQQIHKMAAEALKGAGSSGAAESGDSGSAGGEGGAASASNADLDMLRSVASRISGKAPPLPMKTTIGGGPNGDAVALKDIALKMGAMAPNDAAALGAIAKRLTACNPDGGKKPCGESGADEADETEDGKALKDVAVKLMKLAEPPAASPAAANANTDLWKQVKALENGFAEGAGSGAAGAVSVEEGAEKSSSASSGSGSSRAKTPLEDRVESLEKGILGEDSSSGSESSGSSSGSSSSGSSSSGSGSESGSSSSGSGSSDSSGSPSSGGSGSGSAGGDSSSSGGSGSSGSSSGSSASGSESGSSSSGSGSSSDASLWKRPKTVKRGSLPNGVDMKPGKGDGNGKKPQKGCPDKTMGHDSSMAKTERKKGSGNVDCA